MRVRLPATVLDADPTCSLEISAAMRSASGMVELDASEVVALQPVGLCLLANAAKSAAMSGKRMCVVNACDSLRATLDAMNCQISWSGKRRNGSSIVGSTLAMSVGTQAEANNAANSISRQIAEFIPAEDREAMLQDHYGLRIHHAVQPALAYILAELLDNVFSHSRTTDYPSPTAWLATQWYAGGDLVRVAVADDGCGLLGSLRGLDSPPQNHFEAVSLAFEPFVSSKNAPLLYADRRHMGIGLTVCRDICQRLSGHIYAASGNARVMNAGLEDQENRKLDSFHQGTIVSMEFHRRAATTRTLPDILAKYSGSPDLRPRFG